MTVASLARLQGSPQLLAAAPCKPPTGTGREVISGCQCSRTLGWGRAEKMERAPPLWNRGMGGGGRREHVISKISHLKLKPLGCVSS